MSEMNRMVVKVYGNDVLQPSAVTIGALRIIVEVGGEEYEITPGKDADIHVRSVDGRLVAGPIAANMFLVRTTK